MVNGYVRMPNGTHTCALCWQNFPSLEGNAEYHFVSKKDHVRRAMNMLNHCVELGNLERAWKEAWEPEMTMWLDNSGKAGPVKEA